MRKLTISPLGEHVQHSLSIRVTMIWYTLWHLILFLRSLLRCRHAVMVADKLHVVVGATRNEELVMWETGVCYIKFGRVKYQNDVSRVQNKTTTLC